MQQHLVSQLIRDKSIVTQLSMRSLPPRCCLGQSQSGTREFGEMYSHARSTLETLVMILDPPSPPRLNEVDLFALTKFATPEFADKLLARGVHIDRAKGPEGQTVWHAVVETHEQPERMFDWLLLYSAKACNISSSNGNTPLMLAAQLGRVNAVAWLSRHSDLHITNVSNGLTAPELVAKCQTNESIVMFKIILGHMALDKKGGRELTRKLPRAIHDGRRAYERRLTTRKLRQSKGRAGLEQQHDREYRDCIMDAEKRALAKFWIVGFFIGIPVDLKDVEKIP